MIEFIIGGRKVDPRNVGDALMRSMLENISNEIREKIGSIRDPETGAFPTVIIRGDDLDNLQISVEGSPEVIELVKQQLGDDGEETVSGMNSAPKVFLSYTSDDIQLAQRIAESLQESGIDTWWDKWCIRTGDSFRQMIDEGLAGCTHFLVLLTPQSIDKPWVNQEMDAGLVRKLRDECRFLPVRYKLESSALPPLLSGMHAPEISADEDITQLINDIYGVSRKPPLGPAPAAIASSAETQTGYSAAANAIAKWFVENTKKAVFADPQIEVTDLAERTGLTVHDVKDALYELSGFFKSPDRHNLVKDSLFSEFDQYWKPWNTADDALRLAADAQNDSDFPSRCQEIADRYGWEPRRLNPAIAYLFERGVLFDRKGMGERDFVMPGLVFREDELRRFVKSRS